MWQTTFFERPKSPPTRDKHQALSAAFHTWLGATHGPRTVFDGFAGAGLFSAPPGAPDDDRLGSPLLLLRWCATARSPLRLVLAEKNPVNHARLLEALAAATPHAGVDVVVRLQAFEACAAGVIASVPPATRSLFSFVDPYTLDGLTFATLRSLTERGDLLLHLATHQVLTKLVTPSGASPRQARRMDALLGGVVPWIELRRHARDLAPAAALALVPDLLARALARDVPSVMIRVLTLRDGKSHLVHGAHLP